MRGLALVLCVVGLGWLSGCGAAFESSSVSHSFAGRFGCRSSHVTRVGSGYRVEGCGYVADYACIDTHDPERFSHGHGLGAALVEGLVDAALHSNQCFLSFAERLDRIPQLAPGQPVAVHRTKAKGGAPALTTRTLFTGGYLAVTGKPALHPEHVLLLVHSVARLPTEACAAELFHDGLSLPIESVERAGPYDVRLLVKVDALREVDRAVRFAGTVCGLEIELDESARKTLGVFEARFREERIRAEQLVARSAPVRP